MGSTIRVSRKEYEGMKETIETLQDTDALDAIEKGLHQLESGKTHKWEDVKEDLDINTSA
jgi:PHD/YefM family antitoxin component YafN of YafNO toxin-antitoxin module